MKLISWSVLVTIAFFGSQLLAQDNPAPDVLLKRIQEQMPLGWRVENYREIAARRSDDPIAPEVALRFEVDALNEATLYLPDGTSVGPFAVMLESIPQGTVRRLYGTMQLKYGAGEWQGGASIENPVDAIGRPIDAFVEPSVVAGSEQYEKALQAIRDDGVKGAQRRLQEEIEEISRQHGVTKLSVIDENTAELEAIRASHAQEKQRLLDSFQSEIAEIRRNGAAEVAAIEAETEAAIARTRVGFETRLSDLLQMNEQSVETLALQEEIIARREAMLDNEAWLIQLSRQVAQFRNSAAGAFRGTWEGVGNCESNPLRFTFRVVYDELSAGSLTGSITVLSESTSRFEDQIGRSLVSRLSLVSEIGELPAEVMVSSQGSGTSGKLLNMSLRERDDGSLEGIAGENQDCRVVLSR